MGTWDASLGDWDIIVPKDPRLEACINPVLGNTAGGTPCKDAIVGSYI